MTVPSWLSLILAPTLCLPALVSGSSSFLEEVGPSAFDHVDVVTGGLALRSKPLLSMTTTGFGDIKVELLFLAKAPIENKLLGPGWIVPVWDAFAIPIEQDYWHVLYPNGHFAFFKKSTGNSYLEMGGPARAALNGNRLTIQAADGTSLSYKDGRPEQLTSSTGTVLHWQFQNDRLLRVYESTGGQLTISYEKDALTFQAQGRSASLGLGKRLPDSTERASRPVATVRKIVDADEREAVVEFSRSAGLMEAMLVDPDRIFPPHRNDIVRFLWNPATGSIAQADSACFEISEPDIYTGMFPKISRISPAGTESFHLKHQGRIVEMKHIDGSGFVGEHLVFPDAGSKLRKAEYHDAAGAKYTIFRGNYDEKGRLLRATDMNEDQLDFLYDQSEPGEVRMAAKGSEIYRKSASQREVFHRCLSPFFPRTDFERSAQTESSRSLAARQPGKEIRAEITAQTITITNQGREQIYPLKGSFPSKHPAQWNLKAYLDKAFQNSVLESAL